jgi:hypothetical protein
MAKLLTLPICRPTSRLPGPNAQLTPVNTE